MASSRKRQSKVGTRACFDFCERMSQVCKNPAMLLHVDMIYLAKQAKRDVEKNFAFEIRTVTKSNHERDTSILCLYENNMQMFC